MAIERTRLPNGVVVLSERLESYGSASIGVWLGAGSRMESAAQSGLAHFYEHMVFKGTATRSPLDLVRAVESRGGYINAYTTKEHTSFYARVQGSEVSRALDVLLDMVQGARLDLADVKLEREVILEEIRGADDTPEDTVQEILGDAIWGQQGLGLPIAGTLKSVRHLGQAQLRHYQEQLLREWPVVISAAGRVDHAELVEQVRIQFASKTRSRAQSLTPSPCTQGMRVRRRDVQQATLAMGCTLEVGQEVERTALGVIHTLLGDGMSSRLFQRIREELGLVYAVYTRVHG